MSIHDEKWLRCASDDPMHAELQGDDLTIYKSIRTAQAALDTASAASQDEGTRQHLKEAASHLVQAMGVFLVSVDRKLRT